MSTRCGAGVKLDQYEPRVAERKIQNALNYPHCPIPSHRELEPIYKPKKPIRSYTDADLRNFPHWAQDNVKAKLDSYKSQELRSRSSSRREIKSYHRPILSRDAGYESSLDQEDYESTKRRIKDLIGPPAEDYKEIFKQQLDNYKNQTHRQYTLQKAAAYKTRVRLATVVKKKRTKLATQFATSTMPTAFEAQFEYSPEMEKQAAWSLRRLKKQIQGKTSESIKNILLQDSLENISKGGSTEYTTSFQDQEQYSGTRRSRRAHIEMMDERMTKQLDDSFMEPLDHLKGELKGFSRKESSYLQNKR